MIASHHIVWLLWISSIITGVVGIIIIGKGWFGDLSKGNPRCPKCWYQVSKSVPVTCPECGEAVDRTIDLYRNRRSRYTTECMIYLTIF